MGYNYNIKEISKINKYVWIYSTYPNVSQYEIIYIMHDVRYKIFIEFKELLFEDA